MAKKKEVDLTSLDLGACIDALYVARAERLAKQKEVEALAVEESRIKDYLLQTLAENKLEGARGRLATAATRRTIVPVLKEWDAFTEYVRKNRAFDLFERRVSRLAFRERLDAGKTVPGVEPFTVVELSLTKSGKGE
jgi:hypothetical protein